MILQYCSDLHLEFPENKKFIKTGPLQPKGDVLLLAGDIVPLSQMDKYKDFFNYVSDNFKLTYWIPGNHEYYYFDAAKKSGILNEKIKSNVFLVNNVTVNHGNINLIFSTLWSNISEANEWHIEHSVNDFRLIKYNGHRLSSMQFNQLHQDSIHFIKKASQEAQTGKTIVITHHVPTLLNIHSTFKSELLY